MGWVINPEWNPADPPGTHPQRITVPHVHSATQNAAGMIHAPGFSLDGYTFTEDGRDVRPFIQGDIPARTGAGANGMEAGGPEAAIAEASFDGGPSGAEVVQRSAFAALQYDVNDSTSVFAQVMTGRTESNTHGRRGNPEMGQQYYGTIYVDNAFLPETLRQAMIDEGLDSIQLHKIGQVRGPGMRNFYDDRSDANISRMVSATIGVDHQFANGWDLRASYQRGSSKLTTAAHNIVRIDRWYMAMDAVRDPNTGAIVCNVQRYNPTPEQLAASMEGRLVATTRITEFPDGVRTVDSPIVDDNAIRDCQPLNVFGLGNVSQAAADYVVGDKRGIRDLDQDFAEVLLTGELHHGWGAGPVSFAAGLTWRNEWFNQFTQPIDLERSPANAPEVGIRGMSPGITGGNRSLNLFSSTSWATGEFDVSEWFSEFNLPVWASDRASRRLDANLAFRRSDYSASGEIDSWKAGAEFQLFRDLRFRATRSRDVREPTFGEQFEAGGGGANITDPVDNTSYTITALSGGNPNLRPEEADTLTAGFVYTPTFADWINGFQFAADYYKIDVDGRVGSLGAQRIIDDCAAGDQSLCALITRSPVTGLVERVLNVNLNVAAAVTSGVDVEMRYQHEPDFFANASESLFFRLFAGYLGENSVTTTVYRDDVGSQASPEWNATATAGYTIGNFGVRAIGRYYDSTLANVRWVEGVDVDDNTISSQTVWNLAFSYSGVMGGGTNWTASFNINNIFDRDPPIIPTQSQRGGQQLVGNNFDVFGRRYEASVSFSF
jgi:outer membrane receptor protein involved in Fe transport